METTRPTVCHIDLEQEHALSVTLSDFILIILIATTCKNDKKLGENSIGEKKLDLDISF